MKPLWQSKTCESCLYRANGFICRLQPVAIDSEKSFYPTVAFTDKNKKTGWYPACSKWETAK